MIVMLDTSQSLDAAEAELRHPVEQLLTPLTRFSNRRPEARFAIDNGAFSRFDRKAFEALLAREDERRHLCRFVAVPDVVASARRTLEVFDYWYPLINHWPLALVCQDGQENLPIPWEQIAAVFIGGSTEWKESDHARAIVKAAKAMDTWVHVGRINTPDRFAAFKEWGADSCDGSGIAQYSHMRRAIGDKPALFSREELLVNV
jgi:hypothetical protein